MNAAERGIVMLCSRLGDPLSQPLSHRQFHSLRMRLQNSAPVDGNISLSVEFLRGTGLPDKTARQIMNLILREPELDSYLLAAERCGVSVITRLNKWYPRILEQQLQLMAPPVLFCKGNISLLKGPFVSLVGSRKLREDGRALAERVGQLAAREGYVLVSGGALGADSAAQAACLASGGNVIVFSPGKLSDITVRDQVLFCSEEGFELEFSSARALGRNRLIHAMGELTVVAQCDHEHGGTWKGSVENLRNGYSPLFVRRDGSDGAMGLLRNGASELAELKSLHSLCDSQLVFLQE